MSCFSNTSSESIRLDTKLRSLPLKETNQLINILNRNNSWRELAAVITHPDNSNKLLFNSDKIGVLENQLQCRQSSPAEEMLIYWKTSGRNHPDLSNLIDFLKTAELHRAVSDVRTQILKENADNDSNTLIKPPEEDNEADMIAEILSNVDIGNLPIFSYSVLQNATNNFSSQSTLGEGAFGTVYRAIMMDSVIAVKRLRDPLDRQFITELNILTRYQHENLLQLLGCSLNGPTHCLVYEYMVNGSLQERLACIGNSEPLPWNIRLIIAYDSAKGINHLHTSGETPMVHRDIKSANILLDEKFNPKVGDFGLVRIGNSSNSTLRPVTENVWGTTVYMAPEAFRGDVSVKLDTFSFGVVLLELLTGLPPVDNQRENVDLITHVQDSCGILNLLDPKIKWNTDAALKLYGISERCLAVSKKKRPTIFQILDDLDTCLSYTSSEKGLSGTHETTGH